MGIVNANINSMPQQGGALPQPAATAGLSNEEAYKSHIKAAQGLDADLSKYMDYAKTLSSNGTFDRALAEQLKGQLGVKTGQQLINEALSRGKVKAKKGNELGHQSDAMLGDAITRRIQELTRQQGDIRGKALEAYRGAAGEREAAATGALNQQAEDAQSAIQDQLSAQLEQAGLEGGMARQSAGAMLAAKGLGRSSQATQDLGNITLEEQAQKGQARVGAAQAQQGVAQAVDTQKKQLAQARERAQFSNDLSSLQSLDDLNFGFDANAVQNEINTSLQNMQANYEKNASLKRTIGSIVGTAGKIFAGGL